MDAKLTLKLDKAAIETAKAYAKAQGTSVSRMVEEFFQKLKTEKRKTPEQIVREANLDIDWDNIQISDEIKAMRTGKGIPADADYDQMRWEHYKEKYDL